VHVPGWHEATRKWQQEGKIQMAGIIEEQHPDRARLFMQWKQMPWPVLVDSLDLLGVSAVPTTLAIDEYGVIRMVDPEPTEIEEKFINRTFERPSSLPEVANRAPDLDVLKQATRRDAVAAWSAYANALVEWGGPERTSDAIQAYQGALRREPGSGPLHFRLGVAYRKRYDSNVRQSEDFQNAVEQWSTALEIDPNQYIWRRRIQQYGPRLDKPYSFYDWVVSARNEIVARGEIPSPLSVEPSGAEFALSDKSFAAAPDGVREPDPRGRILRDAGQFIVVETAVVPNTRAEEVSERVHVVFRLNPANKTHWNNEAGRFVFWVSTPVGWNVSQHLTTIPNPSELVSREPREVEFEVRGPKRSIAQAVTLPAYALYYVCEDLHGVCMYRRQDVPITIVPSKMRRDAGSKSR
jgi:tetratricopeptide (TPR) repeat protein